MKKIFKDIEDNFCAAILLAMLILTFVNVVARKLLNSSMPFVEELTTCGLMMLSIIGAATAAKRGAHLGLSLFTDMMPPKAQRYVALVGDILAAAFSGLIVYYGYFMVLNEYANKLKTAGMSWPEWLFGIWLPIGGAVLVIRYIQLAIKNFKSAKEAENK